MLRFDSTMMSSNQSNNMNADDSENEAKASWGDAACFNKSDYRLDTLLGIASSSLFANMELESLGPMQSFQEESRPRVNPLDMISEVLEELSGDEIFGSADDDFEDTFALEPTPLDTSRMNIVDSLPLNLYNTKDISLFKETLSTRNTSEKPLPLSHPVTPMSCLPDTSTSDSSRKRKHQLEGVLQQTMSKGQREQERQDEEEARRFRPYQAELWTVKFAELLEFRHLKGHCCVPYTYGKNPALARWVKRQRYQYKLKIESKQSTMTDERVEALEEHGFIWDSHGAAWQERWTELAEYQGLYGNCNVPSNYASNPQLATWIKCQRRQYKLYYEGKANTTTPERIAELESLGFEWELRKSSK
jgi:hypothetical protein